MAVAPNPSQIFKRAVEEGERRLDQTLLELTATGFIAGFTVVFGIVALGIVHALAEPLSPELARIAGSLAFGIGLVFLIVGRAELFSENFFDPSATVFQRWSRGKLGRLARLWAVTFLFNLTGGALFAWVMSAHGVLPDGAGRALATIAEDIAGRGAWTGFVKAVVGGALVALLSFLLGAVNSIGSRISLAFAVGFLLALGPFDHVIVTVLHLFIGLLFGADVGLVALGEVLVVSTVGNLVGGIGLTTLTHIAQAKGAEEAGE